MHAFARACGQAGRDGWVGGWARGRAGKFYLLLPFHVCASTAHMRELSFPLPAFSLSPCCVCCEPTRQEYRSRAAFRHSTVHFSTFTVMRASPCPGNGRLVVGSGGGRCLGNLCIGNHSRVGESNNAKAHVLAIILELESQAMLRLMSWKNQSSISI